MKRLALLALAVTLVAVPATAQTGMPSEFGVEKEWWARIAEGEIPTTNVSEPAGWNVAEYLRFSTEGTEHRIPVAADTGELVDVFCACGNATLEGTDIVIADAQEGDHVVRLVRNFPASSAILVDFALFGGQEGIIYAYVPQGAHVDTSADLLEDPLPCTSAPCEIHQYGTEGNLHFAILPGPAPGTRIIQAEDGFPYLTVILGILGGMLLWAFLVQRGVVQRRRRQEVTTAAHKTAAASESKPVLEARKRVLMAGLKEIEMAKMNKQVDDATYDKLKSELKKQTVTVMRALEEAS